MHLNDLLSSKDNFGIKSPTVYELAKKYGVDVQEVLKQLIDGIKVEREHTKDDTIAKEIALDHIGEDLYYYVKLRKVEKPINEIIKSAPLETSKIEYDRLDFQKIDITIEGLPVYIAKKDHQLLFLIKDNNNETVASLVLGEQQVSNKNCFMVTRLFTEQKYRGKGYAIKLLIDVKKEYGYMLISDHYLTDDGEMVWKKLARQFPIQLIDYTNGDRKEISEIPNINTTLKDHKYLYVWELFLPLTRPIAESRLFVKPSFDYHFVNNDICLRDV
jgi:GNAT superfamily N-acetyltransferase